jgi:probable HAF family extracellular repeat protein
VAQRGEKVKKIAGRSWFSRVKRILGSGGKRLGATDGRVARRLGLVADSRSLLMSGYARLLMLATSILCAATSRAAAASFTFQGLGDLPGGGFESASTAVSADGSTVVGRSISGSGYEAFRWTSGGGMVGLGYLPPFAGPFGSLAQAASADGSVVVGISDGIANYAFRWTSGGPMVAVGTDYWYANDVSADGSVIVGEGSPPGGTFTQAYRYTSGGTTWLGHLPGDVASYGLGVSADGNVIVGPSLHSPIPGGSQAYRWTPGGGMVGLGYLPGAGNSTAVAVSGDGSTIVGFSSISGLTGWQGVQWTSGGIATIPIDPSAISYDGSVIVGSLAGEASLWTSSDGVLYLRNFLIANGATGLTGWTLAAATGISADGRTIVGTGINPLGDTEAWIATVPEPSSLVLGTIGLALTSLVLLPARRLRKALAIMLAAWVWVATTQFASAVMIDTVAVGNPGNAPDTTGRGAVSYEYRIGTYEVTNSQYAEFLNAKAASDPFDLYSLDMGSVFQGGITRSGTSGSYAYAVKPNMGDKPVIAVRPQDALRFANWLHNGQGSGDTETGAYTMSLGEAVTRNPGAAWFLPSTNEWYKAAYHQPAAQGGDFDNYWLYPTKSNNKPTSDQPPGSTSPVPANTANFYDDDGSANGYNDGWATTSQTAGDPLGLYLTDVGAYTFSKSYYNTFDQAGNVEEWTEGYFTYLGPGPFDQPHHYWDVAGGSWDSGVSIDGLLANGIYPWSSSDPEPYPFNRGFRVATIVPAIPEPSVLVLGAIGMLSLCGLAGSRYGRCRKGAALSE